MADPIDIPDYAQSRIDPSPVFSRRLTPSTQRVVRSGARLGIEQRIAAANDQEKDPLGAEIANKAATAIGWAAQNTRNIAEAWKAGPQLAPLLGSFKSLGDMENPQDYAAWARSGDLPQPAGFGRTDSAGRTGFGAGATTPTLTQRVDPGLVTGNPSQDELRDKMAQSERDAATYQEFINGAQSRIDELNALKLAAVQANANDVAAEYDVEINDLNQRIGEARVGLSNAMSAFKHYSDQVGPAYQASVDAAVAGELAMQESLEGRPEAAAAAIEASFDEAGQRVVETAKQIGTGNEPLEASLEAAVGMFSNMMAGLSKDRIEDTAALGDAAAMFATATAKAAKAEDEFMTDIERKTLKVKIESQIDDMLDSMARLQRDKQRAVQNALDQYDPSTLPSDPDEMWKLVFDDLSATWSLEDLEAVKYLMDTMRSQGVTTEAEARDWILKNKLPGDRVAELTSYLEDYYMTKHNRDGIPEPYLPLVEIIGTSPNSVQGKQAIEQLGQLLQDPTITEEGIAELFSSIETDYSKVFEAFDTYEEHLKRWNEARANAGSGGSEAVANYANRNDPAYVRRRNVGVPTIANAFNDRFGYSGRENVGGVTSSLRGALRNPNMTGNGRSSNSDHLSGGAVDLYADTEADRKAIERWANSRPDVSYVIYSGNKAHEGHHVHVSLLLNYNPGGDQRST